MIGTGKRLSGPGAAIAIALLLFSLALRLAAPAVGLPAPEGYIAICSGSQIVYIPASDFGSDGPPGDDGVPASDPCPWLSQFHAVEPEPLAPLVHPVAYTPVDGRTAVASTPRQRPLSSFHARAPPVPDAEHSLAV